MRANVLTIDAVLADGSAHHFGEVAPDLSDVDSALRPLAQKLMAIGTREAGAQIAFMNNSGVRTALIPKADGAVSYGDIYAVQPFGNTLVTNAGSNGKFLGVLDLQVDGGGVRGIICGARNFAQGDLVVVALPGTVLPGGFEIASRSTYGKVSDGMICSERELALGDNVFVGDRNRDLSFHLEHLILHIENHLLQHFLRFFRAIDQIVERFSKAQSGEGRDVIAVLKKDAIALEILPFY